MSPAPTDADSPEHSGTRHLPWCMPGACETITFASGVDETLHHGAPDVWQMDGDDADVLMRRGQFSGVGETHFEVMFTHRGYPEAITLFFSRRDVDRFVAGVTALGECD